MKRVRWGIVGAGRIAETFAADIRHAPSAVLRAIASRDRTRAETFARRQGIPRFYGAYDDLFADPEVDAVYIATPHSEHFSNASGALTAGKAVLCEKPLTACLADCDRLLEIAAARDVFLMEAMWTWFLPAVQQAKAWLEGGRIGRLLSVTADFGFKASYDPRNRLFDPALAGGCLLDIGIYPIALSHFLIGAPASRVDARALFAPTGVEDEISMDFRYGDIGATFIASFRRELSNRAIVRGDEGRIEMPLFWQARECRLFRADRRVDRYADPRTGSGFEFEIESASRDILAGRRQSEVMPHAASRALQKAMEQVARRYR